MEIRKKICIALAALACLGATAIIAGEITPKWNVASMRDGVPLDEEQIPSPIMTKTEDGLRQQRNYPEQPPVIPHKIDGYELDLNVNKCMSCHGRAATGISQAPMVSITHYMSRDGQFLATVSPRRYDCKMCHVPQHEARPLVENEFIDVDSMVQILRKQQEDN